MSLFAEQYRPGRVGPCDLAELGGNLCRCTGYRPIRDAALSLGPAPVGPFLERLSHPAPLLEPVAYTSDGSIFERPATLEECFDIATAHLETRWIAGATDLGVEANLKFRRWPLLVSLEGVPELQAFIETKDSVRIGTADILEDAGTPVSPIVDRGQIEGGFIQGVGWMMIEELLWDAQGRVATAGASTCKLPSWSEMPPEFHVNFLERAAEPGAVGEPPLMLAISVREAIRDVVAAFGNGGPVALAVPATPERVFFAIRRARQDSQPVVSGSGPRKKMGACAHECRRPQ